MGAPLREWENPVLMLLLGGGGGPSLSRGPPKSPPGPWPTLGAIGTQKTQPVQKGLGYFPNNGRPNKNGPAKAPPPPGAEPKDTTFGEWKMKCQKTGGGGGGNVKIGGWGGFPKSGGVWGFFKIGGLGDFKFGGGGLGILKNPGVGGFPKTGRVCGGREELGAKGGFWSGTVRREGGYLRKGGGTVPRIEFFFHPGGGREGWMQG